MNLFATAGRPGPATPLPPGAQAALAGAVKGLAGWGKAYPASALSIDGGWIVAGRSGRARGIAVGHPAGRPPAWVRDLPPGAAREEDGVAIRVLPGDHAALGALRRALPFLQPRVSGGRPSFGFGDRLGVATPGHLAAVRGTGFFPILAQQSVREMTRTRRTPDDVIDDAVFGVLQAGWTEGFGADADHLKTAEDADRMVDAGFVFITIDPSAVVDDAVGRDDDAALEAKYRKVLAEVPGAAAWEGRYLDRPFAFTGSRGPFTVSLGARAFREAAVKYGRAVAHIAALAGRVRERMGGRAFEIEASVDETASPTAPGEHVFVAAELRERGIAVHSLAPRFLGDFEKGIDYKGDLGAFEASIDRHAAIARALGGYKISVHSGSDKFAVYPAVARATAGRLHVKTAGTNWLEALRVAARRDPSLFREIAAFARGRYGEDRASYHVTAAVDAVPAPGDLPDADLERVYLDGNDGRQILHVTFGSVLTAAREGAPAAFRFRDRLLDLLVREEETYAEVLVRHLGKHLRLLTPG